MNFFGRIAAYLKNKSSFAFTMVEMSAVLLIISALIVGIVAANKLSRQGEINSVIADITEIREAALKFKEMYGQWPGDLQDITRLPSTDGTTVAGNGDGVFTTAELAQFLHHLYLAKLINPKISGNHTTVGDVIAVGGPAVVGYTPGNLYPSKIKNVGYYVAFNNSITDKTQGISVLAYKVISGTASGFLTPQEMKKFDNDFDDGTVTKGGITAIDYSNKCLTTGNVIDLTKKSEGCGLSYNIINLGPYNATTSGTASVASTLTCLNNYIYGQNRISDSTYCPSGYRGAVIESCTAPASSAAFTKTHTTCQAMKCYGGGSEGETRQIACPYGYSGMISQTCHLGNWVYTNWMLPTATPTFPCSADTQKCTGTNIRVLACPFGYTGYIKQTCTANAWVMASTATCSIMQCTYGAAGNRYTTMPFGSSSTNYSGANSADDCSAFDSTNYKSPVGATGGVEVMCPYGSITTPRGAYAKPVAVIVNDFCAEKYANNTANPVCNSGSVNTTKSVPCKPSEIGIKGTITQTCVLNGSNYMWITTDNKCEPKTCGGAPLGTVRMNTRGVLCPTVTVGGAIHREMSLGTVVEVCTDNGATTPPSWVLDYSNCVNAIS